MRSLTTAALGAMLAFPALAQQFTTAEEVRPILEATRGSWIAVREYDGQDLLYFTHLASWRCGLSEIRYGVNGAEPAVWEMEPCHEGTAQPNALTMESILPYVVLPLGSVETVNIVITYDDGEEAQAEFSRASVLMP